MNILEQEDLIKGLPDAALMQEASAPSGQVPQFLVVSEIKRRSDMRKRFEKEQQPQGTVKEQIMMEAMGIGTMMPTAMTPPAQPMGPAGPPPNGAMPPPMGGMPPQGAPPMAPPMPQGMPPMPQGMPPMPQGGIASAPQAMPPMGMAQGGIVRMQQGGPTDLLDLVAAGASPVELLRRGYTEEQIRAARAQYQAKMSAPIEVVGGIQQIQDSPTRTPQVGYGDRYDEPFVRGITDVIADKASDLAGAVGQGIESLGIAAEKNMPNYSLFGRNDLSLPSIPMPERRSQEAMAGMFSPDQIAERLANRPSLADDLNMTPMDFVRQRVLEQEEAGDARVQANTSAEVQPGSTAPSGDAFDFLNKPFPDAKDGTVADPVAALVTTVAEAQDQVGRTPQRSSDSERGISGKEAQASPVLDFSDLIGDSKQQALANAMIQLGAGVASGDVSKGLAAAGTAAMKGTAGARELDMRRRLAEYQAGREDIRRGDEADRFERQMGLQERKLDIGEGEFDERIKVMREEITAKLGISRNANNREVLQSIDNALKAEIDPTVRADLLEMRQIMSAILSPELMAIMGQDAPTGSGSSDPLKINSLLGR